MTFPCWVPSSRQTDGRSAPHACGRVPRNVLPLASALLATIMVAGAAAADKTDEDSGIGVDGSGSIVGNASFGVTMVLFRGATPRHGFQIQITGGGTCPTYVSDVGPPDNTFFTHAFWLSTPNVSSSASGYPSVYTTPPEYRPPGPVYVGIGPGCSGSQFTARMW
jgi:hypothetical protein